MLAVALAPIVERCQMSLDGELGIEREGASRMGRAAESFSIMA
jgi:hypothetical protein